MADSSSLALLFPGQGTEAVGMSLGWESCEAWNETLDIMERGSGFPLRRWMSEGPLESLQAPRHAPCSVIAHSVGLYRAHRAAGMPLPRVATGHSLGFYSATVASGVVPLEAVLDLVNAVEDLCEAKFGQDPHGMAFFIGLTEMELRQGLADHPELTLSNINGKSQFTVSGPKPALQQLMENLGPKALKTGLLPVLHPLHGTHMVPLLPELMRKLIRWKPMPPSFPLLSHADGRMLVDAQEIWDEAIASVGLPVCWLEVVKAISDGSSDVYECGHGSQLANLTRWANRGLKVTSLQNQSVLMSWQLVG